TVTHRHPLGCAPHHHTHKFTIVLDVLLRLAFFDPVQRRLRDEYVAALNQLIHVAEEEREQQRANVRSVHVSVCHQDHLAVAQPRRIEIFLADTRAQSRDHGPDLFVAQHLVVAGLFYIQDLALERQNRLETPVPALLGRSSCGFTLYQEQFAAVRIAFRTVSQLAWQSTAIERAFAPREIAGFAGSFSRPSCLNGLVDDLFCYGRILFEDPAQPLIDERLHYAGNV